MFNTGNFNIRSQDLEEAYHDAAQFYWGRVQSWLVGKPMFSAEAAPVILPRHLVEDIDTPEDWARAELMYHAMVQSEAISEKPCQ
jgi:N-acylneuraminate cytidylyltransferase